MRHLLIIFFTILLFSSCDPPATTTTTQPTAQTPIDTTSNPNTPTDTSQTSTKTPDATKKDESGGAIVGKWIHSNEDDNAQVEVYRPESFNFPPSRGRESIVIRDDGTFDFITIAPNDSRLKNSGKWTLENGKYSFTLDGSKNVSFTAKLEGSQLKKDKA